MYYTYKNHIDGINYFEKSDYKYKMIIMDITYANLWFVTSTDLYVISSELLSLPQTISLYNKMELISRHYDDFVLREII